MTELVIICLFPAITFVAYSILYTLRYALFRRASPKSWETILLLAYPALLLIALCGLSLARRNVTGGLHEAAELHLWPAIAAQSVLGAVLGGMMFWCERKILAHFSRPAGRDQGPLSGLVFRIRRAWIAAFIVVIAVAAEEVLWRGYLIHDLKSVLSVSTVTSVVLSAAAFGINHVYFGIQQVVIKCIWGLLWGAVFVYYGSLAAPIVSHAIFNLLILHQYRNYVRKRRDRPAPAGAQLERAPQQVRS